MTDNGIKISYAAALFRVRVEFSRAATLASALPPVDVLQRARAKMEAVQKEKLIGFFVTYEQRMEAAWAALRNATGEPENVAISMTIAAGAPDIQEIYIDPPNSDSRDDGKIAALLTISAAPAVIAGWKFEWLKLCVAQRMRELQLPGPANAAQLQSLMFKAINGEKIEKFPIAPIIFSGPNDDKSKFYSIVANRGRREVALIIRDIKPLLAESAFEALNFAIDSAAAKMTAATGEEYVVAKKEFIAALRSALLGPERVGLDLPLVILVAYGLKKQSENGGTIPARTIYPGIGKLEVTTDEHKMEGVINNFSMKYYEDRSFVVNPDWINAELDRLGIVFGRDAELLKAIVDKIGSKEDLNGMCVARGRVGVGAKGPLIYPSFKDAKSSAAAAGVNVEKDVLDIREMQQRAIVKVGQLIAEIRYVTPALPGTNIFGHELMPGDSETLSITLGEGVQSRDMQKFYAITEGIPVIEGNTIGLSKVFVHDGDVNLRSGNIRFDGPVEIKGSVDAGSLVDVRGHLMIRGSIRGGTVICTESVEVSGGVVTGPTAFVKVRGNFSAEFIENSRVTCSGDLKVKKAIVNSEIIAGEGIEVTNGDGIVAGGIVSARHTLKSANVGFKRGAATEINVGVDFRIELRIRTKSGRLARVQAKLNEDRQALRELVSKKREQMTSRHEEMKLKLQKRLTKARSMIERLEAALANARSLLVYDQNAKILVSGTLASSCKITCGGNVVIVANEVAGVAITPKRRRGSFIIPIEDISKDEGIANPKVAS